MILLPSFFIDRFKGPEDTIVFSPYAIFLACNARRVPISFLFTGWISFHSPASMATTMAVFGTANTFTLEVTLIIKLHNNTYTVAPATNVNVSISMSGLNFKYVRGFFADQTANPDEQTLDIGTIGDFLEEGTVSFAVTGNPKPKIELNVTNEFGVPLEVTYSIFEARKAGSSIPILINPTSPVTINSPAVLGQ